jgi:hypothetical protein
MRTQVRPQGSCFQIPRRDFLRLGSVAAAGLAATGLSPDVMAGIALPMPLLSIGFCAETLEEIGADEVRPVVAAPRIGGRVLDAHRAQVTVHEFRRAAAHRAEPLDLALLAYSPSIDPATGSKTPFIAWVWRGKPSLECPNRRTSFVVPVGSGDALHLGVERTLTAPPRTGILRRLAGTFSGRDERSEIAAFGRTGEGLALRRGTYFLAVRESADDQAPSWASLHVARGESGAALRTLGGGEPPFSYLVISIDAPKA